MTMHVVLLRTTGPDGEPWEKVISPVFQSEAAADAWRSANGLATSEAVLTARLEDVPEEYERYYIVGGILPRVQKAWEAGDPMAVIEALNWCTGIKEPLPDWCEQIVREAARRLFNYEVKTLDDAFGVTGRIHKNKKLFNANQRLRFSGLAWDLVNRFKEDGVTHEQALELALDEMKGQGFQGKTSVIKQWYTEAKQAITDDVWETVNSFKKDGVTHEQALELALDDMKSLGFEGNAKLVEHLYTEAKRMHDRPRCTTPQPSTPRRVVILGDPRRIRD